LQSARDDQERRAGRGRAQQRRRREAHQAHGEHPLAAEEIRQRPRHQDQRPQRQQVGVDDPLLHREAPTQVGVNGGQGDVDDRHVQEGHERAEDAGDQDQTLLALHGVQSRVIRASGPP